MPADWHKLEAMVRETAVDVVWAQWSAIGATAVSQRQAKSVVDPEALLLLSLLLTPSERRLERVVSWWAHTGARLMSVQRAKNLVRAYPPDAKRHLAAFARAAVEGGKDLRWRSLAGRTPVAEPRRKDLSASPALMDGAALLLRLRIGLGVGIKADVLALLLGRAGAKTTVQEVAAATGYYSRAVRRALEEMAAARLIQSLRTAPASFRVDEEAWTRLLDLKNGAPPWRYWQEQFAFVAGLLDWLASKEPRSDYLRSSEARDLVVKHRTAFELQSMKPPEPGDFAGEEYLEPFGEGVTALVDRMRAVV